MLIFKPLLTIDTKFLRALNHDTSLSPFPTYEQMDTQTNVQKELLYWKKCKMIMFIPWQHISRADSDFDKHLSTSAPTTVVQVVSGTL